jgi:integrase
MFDSNGQKLPAPALQNAPGMAKKQETKMERLFRLVQQDYLNNNHKSKANIDYQISGHLGPQLGNINAERLKTQTVEDYKQLRLNEGAKRSTINLELATIRRALTLGKIHGLIKDAPPIPLFRVGNSNRRKGFFEQDDMNKLLGYLLPYQKHALRFAMGCGMRQGELFKLTWAENYDEDGNCIRIYDSKSGEGRTIPLLDDCALVIEERKLARVKTCPYVFHYRGRPCSRHTFNKHWRKACAEAGVNRLFHDTRRTAVRMLTRSGVYPAIAKAITGHKSDSVFERYNIINEKDLVDAFHKVSDYIKKHTGGNSGNNTPTSSGNLPPDSGNVPPASSNLQGMAERVGFEPTAPVMGLTISSLVSIPKPIEVQAEIEALKAECSVIVRSTNQVSRWISKILTGLTKGKGE